MTEQDYRTYFNSKYQRTSSFTSGLVLMLTDAIVAMLCIGLTFFLVNAVDHSLINFRSFVTYSIYLPVMIAVFYAAGLYPGIMLAPAEEVKRFAICSFFSFMGIALSITVETDNRWPISIALILCIPFATIFLPAGRELARHIFAHFRWWGVPAVIYSSDGSADIIVSRLEKRQDFGYKPALIINSHAHAPYLYDDIPVFPPGKDINTVIHELGIKVAILCNYDRDLTEINAFYRYTIFIPKIQDTNTLSMSLRDFGGILGFSSTHNLTKKFSLLLKRMVDLFFILLASPLVIPVVAIVSVIVKCTSPGPVFYGHVRVGKNGIPIKCWKFRSMVIDADRQLEKILAENPAMRAEWEKDRKFTNDPRVTPIGKFLRKTSIDEIPQLWNIVTGEMSLVGPRPVTTPELTKYGDKAAYILSVSPGLSGMWQISGRSDTGYEERITLDSYYIQNWSIWLDLWIIIKTVWVVFKGKGAY
jgi:Undecaprenyl-phosphate galactose phosphotransferase WbaP